MYAGHFAAGLAIKAKEPRTPTWAVLVGVAFLDLLFGPFVLLGIESVHMTPGASPGFALDEIGWSHSLAMSLAWSLAFAACFRRYGRAVVLALGFAVFSHYLLDILMHPSDQPLWPGSTVHFGLGLWQLWPQGWWWFELGFIALCSAYYYARAQQLQSFGGRAATVIGIVVLLHITNSPWLSPTA
jgi:membrane-bound metal-dependent hydrolase YbcI (DUF457 family)